MWPPPGPSSFPQVNPRAMRPDYTLAKPNTAGTSDVTGPFMATRVPEATGLAIQRDGQMVTITDRIQMPLESQARTRCVITEVSSNVSFEIIMARTFLTFIECLVSRTDADA